MGASNKVGRFGEMLTFADSGLTNSQIRVIIKTMKTIKTILLILGCAIAICVINVWIGVSPGPFWAGKIQDIHFSYAWQYWIDFASKAIVGIILFRGLT